jgi:hypothetical protein
MRKLIRLSLALFILVLLLTPVALFAQSETARQIVELVFSDDKSSITLDDSVTSTAVVTFTHDGKDYQMKVPVTIEIDETIALQDSMSTTESAARVGVYGIEVTALAETTEEVEISYRSFEPSSEEHKLALVAFTLTNLSDSAKEFSSWFSDETLFGIDDAGRRFDNEGILGCGEVNPGDKVNCIAVFNLMNDVTLTKVEIHALDENTVNLPEAQEYVEEEE